jgi:hypothetical protein
LGTLKPTPADPRRDRAGDAGALASMKNGVHGAGLAPAIWTPCEKVFTLLRFTTPWSFRNGFGLTREELKAREVIAAIMIAF